MRHARLRGSRLIRPAIVGGVLVAILAAVILITQLGSSRGLTLTDDQLTMINKLESVLLHDIATPQYDRVVDQSDGGGYRAGVGDFATSDGTALEVVQTYTARVGANDLSRSYLPTLQSLAATGSDAIDHLAGYPQAWQQASLDPVFRQVQDDEMRTRYQDPTTHRADDLGVRTPLGFAVLYDSLIQQGDAGGPDSFSSLVTRTDTAAGGSPHDVGEHAWLGDFLNVRLATLTEPADSIHDLAWPSTVGRVRALRQLLDAGDDSLTPPISVDPYGTVHLIAPSSSELGPHPAVSLPPPTTPTTTARPTSGTGRPTATATRSTTQPTHKPTPTPTTPYRLGQVTGLAGLCLNVDGGVAKPGNEIKTWTCNGTEAQFWTTPTDGTLRALGMCAQIATDSFLLELDFCSQAASQQWRFAGGHVVNPATGLCLTVPNDQTDPGAQLAALGCADLPGQRWIPPGSP